MSRLTPADFAAVHDQFDAALMPHDCGRKCAPLNGGEPVCCSTRHAIPVCDAAEWQLLRTRTALWRLFEPYDAPSRRLTQELAASCRAIECRGAGFCERQHRTLACRAFPFFPYFDRAGTLLGLAYYWTFEDRCWVISNMRLVDRAYVAQFLAAFTLLFERDPAEREVYVAFSATMRRVFGRQRRPIPLILAAGGHALVLPGGQGLQRTPGSRLPRHGPFRSEAAYRRAVAAAGGTLPDGGLAAAAPGQPSPPAPRCPS